jgi:hypothetical protein
MESQATMRLQTITAKALQLAVEHNLVTFQQQAVMGKWRVKLSIQFDGLELERQYTPCEQAIIKFLKTQEGFVSGTAIMAGLETAMEYHGDSTVKHALADLVTEGVLTTGPNGRGYRIAKQL